MIKRNFSKSIIKKAGCFLTSLFMASSLFIAGKPVTAYAKSSSNFTSNVMAPLHVNDWNEFKNELHLAKDMGVNAVSVDVWWGDVEKQGDNQFDWTYYDNIFKSIKDSGLKIVPIMSFHQCGGNVGDTYTSYLPKWLWGKYHGKKYLGKTLDWDDLKYKSELGNTSAEYLSLWIDDLIENEYVDFMNEFENHFSSYAKDFLELNISCGASGELRYPSYNSHDSKNKFSGYPNKGYLQCYSSVAQNDFRNSMLQKYNNLQGINKAWGINLTDISQIRPPMDGENFFYGSTRAYLDSQYGRDFIEWYNKELVNHGRNMINYAEQAFDNQLSNIQLGIKIPGVHWQVNNYSYPRTAEINAGLINTNFDQTNGYGYNPILQMVKEFNGKVTLHFTCLEMNNGQGEPTSAAKTLVGWVGDAAHNIGVEVKGENGLNGGNDDAWFWNNINDAIDNHHYNGFTILRINDAVYGESNRYYRDLISKH